MHLAVQLQLICFFRHLFHFLYLFVRQRQTLGKSQRCTNIFTCRRLLINEKLKLNLLVLFTDYFSNCLACLHLLSISSFGFIILTCKNIMNSRMTNPINAQAPISAMAQAIPAISISGPEAICPTDVAPSNSR